MMKKQISKKYRRLRFIGLILLSLAAAVALALTALRDNVAFFHTPADVAAFRAESSPRVAPGHVFRLGGMVKAGSVSKSKTAPVTEFIVTDFSAELPVSYRGILPDLFREGQGVVAKGSLDANGVFIAAELLAKHDEKYMPPELKRGLERQNVPPGMRK